MKVLVPSAELLEMTILQVMHGCVYHHCRCLREVDFVLCRKFDSFALLLLAFEFVSCDSKYCCGGAGGPDLFPVERSRESNASISRLMPIKFMLLLETWFSRMCKKMVNHMIVFAETISVSWDLYSGNSWERFLFKNIALGGVQRTSSSLQKLGCNMLYLLRQSISMSNSFYC